MKFMVIVKATKESEAGVLPDQQLLTDMGKFNEDLVKAGVMLAGEGLHPSSKGARVAFHQGRPFGPHAINLPSAVVRDPDLGTQKIRLCEEMKVPLIFSSVTS